MVDAMLHLYLYDAVVCAQCENNMFIHENLLKTDDRCITQLEKMSIDLKLVELTADDVRMIFTNYHWHFENCRRSLVHTIFNVVSVPLPLPRASGGAFLKGDRPKNP